MSVTGCTVWSVQCDGGALTLCRSITTPASASDTTPTGPSTIDHSFGAGYLGLGGGNGGTSPARWSLGASRPCLAIAMAVKRA